MVVTEQDDHATILLTITMPLLTRCQMIPVNIIITLVLPDTGIQ